MIPGKEMKTGLRTEIVVSVTLMLAAALLFAGFLLVKLMENELLDQQRGATRDTIRQMVTLLGEELFPAGDGNENAALTQLVRAFRHRGDVVGWRLVDQGNAVLASMSSGAEPDFPAVSSSRLLAGESSETLVYSSGWLPWSREGENYLDLAYPVTVAGEPRGMLQARISLDSLVVRVHAVQRLMLACVLGYGLVLAVFGVFLLNRNVVRPIRRLQMATAALATGSPEKVDVATGPGEIHELAESFNQMVAALETSRRETDAHITSLVEANGALAQARDDLVRSEKMASVGHLAAGMAHEIGNPLGALIGYLGMLHGDLHDPDQVELVRRAEQEVGRIDRLVRELLDYATPRQGEAAECQPVSVLRETVELLEHQGALAGVAVRDGCGEIISRVRIDQQRLQQVWINLLLNARDAMDGGGEVVLSAEQGEGVVCIAVADQGVGMAAEVAHQIFEPFFTTKDPGKGRGLGLSVCQRIVEDAGGRIEVAAESGTGAIFRVTLPLIGEAAP